MRFPRATHPLAVCEQADDAQRCRRGLPKRLGQFGLRLNREQTRRFACGKPQAWRALRQGTPRPTVDSLGCTHSWGRSRTGKARRKRQTAKKRWRRALVEINPWLRQERNARQLPDLWQAVAGKICGHLHSFGGTDNSRALQQVRRAGRRRLFQWVNRRSQRRSCTWVGFLRYERQDPLPRTPRLVPLNPVR